MHLSPEQGGIDWDGLWTLLLSFLVILLTAGVPLFIAYLHVLRIARSTPDRIDSDLGCLVFGKRVLNGEIDAEYRCRLDKVSQLIRNIPERAVWLLGGGAPGMPSEALCGYKYLQHAGLPDYSNIHLEEQSQNTLENLQNAREIMRREQTGQVILISSRYHLARCRLIANSLTIRHRLCAAEPKMDFSPTTLWKLLIEAAYVHWFVVGKSWARLVGNKRMLDRVI